MSIWDTRLGVSAVRICPGGGAFRAFVFAGGLGVHSIGAGGWAADESDSQTFDCVFAEPGSESGRHSGFSGAAG